MTPVKELVSRLNDPTIVERLLKYATDWRERAADNSIIEEAVQTILRLQAEGDEWRSVADKYATDFRTLKDVSNEAATALTAMERERDEAREQWQTNSDALNSMQQNRDVLQRHFNECTIRAEAAEAQVVELRKALERATIKIETALTQQQEN